MEIRYLKLLFVCFMGLWGLFTTLSNFYAWRGTYNAVARVSSLTGVAPTVTPFFKNSSRMLNWFGAIAIVVGKAVATVGLLGGFWHMWLARDGSSQVFNAAKTWAILGGWINVLWLFAGFAFLGETVFYMFASERGASEANTAFRYVGYFALPLLFIGQPD